MLPLPLETNVVATGVDEKEITGVDEGVTCTEGVSVVGAVRVGGIGDPLPVKDVELLREYVDAGQGVGAADKLP